MLSQQIRTHFLEFFEARGHLRVPSAPLVPRDDPSLLLVSAGMVPFKPYFLGRERPPAERLTSCQRAFRTVDIEEVGSSIRHDTFFEMLGNFSFGSYFKAEAIAFAFELLVRDFGLDPRRMFYSVHPEDEESRRLWRQVAGVGDQRIVGLEDNFWQAGPTGPCGVDSEIYYDLDPEGPSAANPATDDRFLEVWNLVFMDSEQMEDGSRRPLARRGVDTGMGLERISMLLQGKGSIFETDLFLPIIEEFQGRARRRLEPAAELRHLRILADHVRGACALLADGVAPLNEGRGYVLRRIVRRALISALSLEVEGGLAPATGVVAEVLGEAFPGLREQRSRVEAALQAEEDRFHEVLERGMDHFQRVAAGGRISGADAFRLHDTYGFPIEMTVDLASARGIPVDREEFARLLEEQRERGRAGRVAALVAPGLPRSDFVGYEKRLVKTAIAAVLAEGQRIERCGPGEQAEVVLESNPFYPEGGGQVGDRGQLRWEGGEALVLDSRRAEGSSLQSCCVLAGQLRQGMEVEAEVDTGRREGAMAHHSATHLLNATLRSVLGPEVVQRGSLVTPEHATFDFGWPDPPSAEQLAQIERSVNAAIRADLPRRVELLSMAEAVASGAIALPDEKYQEPVRVVSFGDYSRELCGGTHANSSGELGAVVITGSRSVGQGLRRLEVRAGAAAERWWEEQRAALDELGAVLRAPADQLAARVRQLQDRLREAERGLRQMGSGGPLAADGRSFEVRGARVAVRDVGFAMERNAMMRTADELLQAAPGGGALVLAGGQLLLKLSPALGARGIGAGAVCRQLCSELGGSGGGRELLAQGKVPDAARPLVASRLRTILESRLEEV